MRIRAALRDLVWRRAASRFEYCQMPEEFDPLPFQFDPVIARQHHGTTTEENLSLSCFECNIHKGPKIAGIDPESREVVALFHPRRDRWRKHFEWSGVDLVGRTSTGRATVEVLAVNLTHRRAFRTALAAEGVFPPK